MTTPLQPRAMGRDLVRRDAAEKVRGAAVYADETPDAHPLYCRLVQATIARGRVRAVDIDVATALDGVLAVLTADDAERLASTADAELAVLQHHDVGFFGQIVALVLAETDEVAREAVELIAVTYDAEPADTVLSPSRTDLYTPEKVNPAHPSDTAAGDMAAAIAQAQVVIDRTYTTPMHHANPMEPHATTALWNPDGDGELTLWDSTQGVHATRRTIGTVLGLRPEQVRVVCPYLGGGFGSKAAAHAHVVAAAMAARARPGRMVKLPLTRQQMFTITPHRTPTIVRVQLAADRAGHLSGIAVDAVGHTSRIKEFAEQTAVPSRTMYAAPNRRTTHKLAALDVPVPAWMRAPGEAPEMFGPEVALDELAHELGIDPVELRIRNEPSVHPESGRPWSSRNLVACLREGAARFGWTGRDPRPRQRRQGDWWVGTGVASSTYPTIRIPFPTSATVRYTRGRFEGRIGAVDLGTGAATILPQILADALGVDVAGVDVTLGDTDLPSASVAGGSSGTTMWGSALVAAAREFCAKFGDQPRDGDEAESPVPDDDAAGKYATAAFGAQFAEVAVHADTGEVRVPRLYGVFAAGRIINPRTARSQLVGGMTMGLGMALFEHALLDPRTGHIVNHDLAGYHVPAHADVRDLQAFWVTEHDPHVNPMGSKGVGEIGIVGTAAAVANAAWHATGVRVRDLPITLDHFLPGAAER